MYVFGFIHPKISHIPVFYSSREDYPAYTMRSPHSADHGERDHKTTYIKPCCAIRYHRQCDSNDRNFNLKHENPNPLIMNSGN